MDNLKYIVIFGVSLGLSLLATPLVRSLALKLNIVDKPDRNLKTHERAVAYLGGAAIFLVFITVLFGVSRGKLSGFHGIVAGSALVFALGLIDDLKKLSVPVKFLVQAVAALILVISGIRIDFLGNIYLNAAVSILWVVGMTNAFNLLDIMDGLSSGTAVIACLAFFVLGVSAGKIFSPTAALALAGAVGGFLVFNFPPAKIFMGDAGSLFIGFMLSALSMTESYSFSNNFAVFAPLLILGVPLFDTIFVMWVRWRKGIAPWHGSPDHIVLKFKRSGLSVRKILVTMYSAAFLLSCLGIFVTRTTPLISAGIYAFLLASAIALAIRLYKVGD